MSTPKHSDVAVFAAKAADFISAKALADSLSLPFCENKDSKGCRYALICDADIVSLIDHENKKMRPLSVDFDEASYKRRLQQASKKNLLAKAVGIKAQHRPSIIDATAGLGKDAFLLAVLGCEVTLIEASPIVYALLSNGLKRAFLLPEFCKLKGRTSVQLGEAQHLLSKVSRADVVYLDPMYPDSKKSALSKRDMQYLQAFLPKNYDMETLFAAAFESAIKRVVVKRPLKGNQITKTKEPNYSLCGSSTRFDVYLCSADSASPTSNTAS